MDIRPLTMTRGITIAAFFLLPLALIAQHSSLPMPLPQANESPVPIPTHPDVVYAIADGQKLRLDVYEPRRHASPVPGIVLIHGGGFTDFDRSIMDSDASAMAHAGFVAFSIDYRLLKPNHHPALNGWPTQLQDCQTAVRWIRQHAVQYQVDPDKIGSYGHSSGGQLAALLGLTDSTDPSTPTISSKVQAVVDLSGISDFTSDNTDPNGDALFVSLFGGAKAQAPNVWRNASPVFRVQPGAPPFLIVHGTRDQDVPIHQSQELVDALKKAGVAVTFLQVDDDHFLHNNAVRQRILTQAAQFFTNVLRRSP
jgi:acetyl esterase/lipase